MIRVRSFRARCIIQFCESHDSSLPLSLGERALPYGNHQRVHRDDSDNLTGLVFVSRNFTMCPEQIGVAPLSRSLASRTLVIPRSCLVNNCLIFSPPTLLSALPPVPSYVLIHSFTSRCLEIPIPGGLGVYERLKNHSNCAHVATINATRGLRRRKWRELLSK